jgi:hypothetical protein
VDVGSTGPLPPDLAQELDALKQRLAEMAPIDLPEQQAARLAQEIGAIRLHLKRLALEREEVGEMIDETLHPPDAAA